MTRWILFGMLVVGILAGPAAAQGADKNSGGWATGGVYVGIFNFDKLNAALAARGVGSLSKYQIMWGGGGTVLASNFSLSAYTYGGDQTLASQTLKVNVHYGGWMVEPGWMPIAASGFCLGVGLGLGVSGFTINAATTDSLAPPFEVLLDSGSRAWSLSNDQFAIAPALNVAIPFSSVGIALKIGYFFTPFDADWRLGQNGPKLHANPDLHGSGPFVSLQLMLGGFSQKTSSSGS